MDPIEPKKGTQKAYILHALRAANGAWIPTRFFIMELGLTQPHARMTELEEDGWPIEHSPTLDARGGEEDGATHVGMNLARPKSLKTGLRI